VRADCWPERVSQSVSHIEAEAEKGCNVQSNMVDKEPAGVGNRE
jgi:hypothetical protein